MSRVPYHPDAFSLSHGQKRPRETAAAHLNFIRELPCLLCGADSEAAHIRYGSLNHGKPGSGASEKPSDKYTVPLCPQHHRLETNSQHGSGDEKGWWKQHGIDPIVISALLWQVSGDHTAGLEICAYRRSLAIWKKATS